MWKIFSRKCFFSLVLFPLTVLFCCFTLQVSVNAFACMFPCCFFLNLTAHWGDGKIRSFKFTVKKKAQFIYVILQKQGSTAAAQSCQLLFSLKRTNSTWNHPRMHGGQIWKLRIKTQHVKLCKCTSHVNDFSLLWCLLYTFFFFFL